MTLNTQHWIVAKEAKFYFYKLLAEVKRSLLSQKYELSPRQISRGKGAMKIDFLMDRKTMCLCFRSSNSILPPSIIHNPPPTFQDKQRIFILERFVFILNLHQKGTCSSDKHLQASLISAFVFFTAYLMTNRHSTGVPCWWNSCSSPAEVSAQGRIWFHGQPAFGVPPQPQTQLQLVTSII